MKTSDKYLKIVQWSKEDKCYVGTCPGLMYGGIHGDDELKVYKELSQAVEEIIDLYKKDKKKLPEPTANKNYSGKFVLRVGKDLHKVIAIRALQNGDSINNYCQKVLKTAVFEVEV
jgi:predicted HicB family RNase H-like nuclease